MKAEGSARPSTYQSGKQRDDRWKEDADTGQDQQIPDFRYPGYVYQADSQFKRRIGNVHQIRPKIDSEWGCPDRKKGFADGKGFCTDCKFNVRAVGHVCGGVNENYGPLKKTLARYDQLSAIIEARRENQVDIDETVLEEFKKLKMEIEKRTSEGQGQSSSKEEDIPAAIHRRLANMARLISTLEAEGCGSCDVRNVNCPRCDGVWETRRIYHFSELRVQYGWSSRSKRRKINRDELNEAIILEHAEMQLEEEKAFKILGQVYVDESKLEEDCQVCGENKVSLQSVDGRIQGCEDCARLWSGCHVMSWDRLNGNGHAEKQSVACEGVPAAGGEMFEMLGVQRQLEDHIAYCGYLTRAINKVGLAMRNWRKRAEEKANLIHGLLDFARLHAEGISEVVYGKQPEEDLKRKAEKAIAEVLFTVPLGENKPLIRLQLEDKLASLKRKKEKIIDEERYLERYLHDFWDAKALDKVLEDEAKLKSLKGKSVERNAEMLPLDGFVNRANFKIDNAIQNTEMLIGPKNKIIDVSLAIVKQKVEKGAGLTGTGKYVSPGDRKRRAKRRIKLLTSMYFIFTKLCAARKAHIKCSEGDETEDNKDEDNDSDSDEECESDSEEEEYDPTEFVWDPFAPQEDEEEEDGNVDEQEDEIEEDGGEEEAEGEDEAVLNDHASDCGSDSSVVTVIQVHDRETQECDPVFVGGAGDCWRQLWSDRLPTRMTARTFFFLAQCRSNWFEDYAMAMTCQDDGDLHFVQVVRVRGFEEQWGQVYSARERKTVKCLIGKSAEMQFNDQNLEQYDLVIDFDKAWEWFEENLGWQENNTAKCLEYDDQEFLVGLGEKKIANEGLLEMYSQVARVNANSKSLAIIDKRITQSIETQVDKDTNKRVTYLPPSTSLEDMRWLDIQFPECDHLHTNSYHDHGVLRAVRRDFETRLHRDVLYGKESVGLVGPSNPQISLFLPNHSFNPRLDARDATRRLGVVNRLGVLASMASTECSHTFQNCSCGVKIDRVVSLHATGGLCLKDFVQGMLRCGATQGDVIMHLPIELVLLDEYEDKRLGCRFKKITQEGKQKIVMSVGESKGYVDDYESVMSWVNMKTSFFGASVDVQVVGEASSIRHIRIKICRDAKLEAMSVANHYTIWDDYYFLREALNSQSLETDNPRWVSVEKEKYDKLLGMVCRAAPKDRTLQATRVKADGLRAATLVGNTQLSKRWDISEDDKEVVVRHVVAEALVKCVQAEGDLKELVDAYGSRSNKSITHCIQVLFPWLTLDFNYLSKLIHHYALKTVLRFFRESTWAAIRERTKKEVRLTSDNFTVDATYYYADWKALGSKRRFSELVEMGAIPNPLTDQYNTEAVFIQYFIDNYQNKRLRTLMYKAYAMTGQRRFNLTSALLDSCRKVRLMKLAAVFLIPRVQQHIRVAGMRLRFAGFMPRYEVGKMTETVLRAYSMLLQVQKVLPDYDGVERVVERAVRGTRNAEFILGIIAANPTGRWEYTGTRADQMHKPLINIGLVSARAEPIAKPFLMGITYMPEARNEGKSRKVLFSKGDGDAKEMRQTIDKLGEIEDKAERGKKEVLLTQAQEGYIALQTELLSAQLGIPMEFSPTGGFRPAEVVADDAVEDEPAVENAEMLNDGWGEPGRELRRPRDGLSDAPSEGRSHGDENAEMQLNAERNRSPEVEAEPEVDDEGGEGSGGALGAEDHVVENAEMQRDDGSERRGAEPRDQIDEVHEENADHENAEVLLNDERIEDVPIFEPMNVVNERPVVHLPRGEVMPEREQDNEGVQFLERLRRRGAIRGAQIVRDENVARHIPPVEEEADDREIQHQALTIAGHAAEERRIDAVEDDQDTWPSEVFEGCTPVMIRDEVELDNDRADREFEEHRRNIEHQTVVRAGMRHGGEAVRRTIEQFLNTEMESRLVDVDADYETEADAWRESEIEVVTRASSIRISGAAKKILLVKGVAASRKTTLVAEVVGTRALFICPTRKLKEELQNRGMRAETMHRGLALLDSNPVERRLVVLDEIYTYSKAYVTAIQILADKLIGLGDSAQIERIDFERIRTPSFTEDVVWKTVVLPVSANVPRDAMMLAYSESRDPHYEGYIGTMGKEHSISFIDEDQKLRALRMCPTRKTKLEWPLFSTIHEAQGSRCETAVLRLPNRGDRLLLARNRYQGHTVVALTRHSKALNIIVDDDETARFLGTFGIVRGVGSLNRYKSRIHYRDQAIADRAAVDSAKQTAAYAVSMAMWGDYRADEIDYADERELMLAVENEDQKSSELTKAVYDPLTAMEGLFAYHPDADYMTIVQESDWMFTNGVPKKCEVRLIKRDLPVVENGTILEKIGIYQSSNDAVSAVMSVSERYARHMKVDRYEKAQHNFDQVLSEFSRRLKQGDVGLHHEMLDKYSNVISGKTAVKINEEIAAAVTSRDEIAEMANELIDRFVGAYLDVGKISHGLNLANKLDQWMESRTNNQLRRMDMGWNEAQFTNISKGFLKTQAKFKAKEGFGCKLEPGQGVAGTNAAFNAVFCSVALEFASKLQECAKEGVLFDSGLNDQDFERWCKANNAYSSINFQADISKQDSTHTIALVLALCGLMEILGFDKWICDALWMSRSHYRVEYMDKLISYVCNFMLRSGEPFTLFGNIVMAAMVIAYEMELPEGSPKAIKGDDVYVRGRVKPRKKSNITQYTEMRSGYEVFLKLDHDKPAFFTSRYITSKNRVYPDYVKMVAKLTCKKIDNSNEYEYWQAWLDGCKPLLEEDVKDVVLATEAHYNKIQYAEIIVKFALSLRDRERWLETVRVEARTTANDCVNRAFKVLGVQLGPQDRKKARRSDPIEVIQLAIKYGVLWHYHPMEATGLEYDKLLDPGIHIYYNHAYGIKGKWATEDVLDIEMYKNAIDGDNPEEEDPSGTSDIREMLKSNQKKIVFFAPPTSGKSTLTREHPDIFEDVDEAVWQAGYIAGVEALIGRDFPGSDRTMAKMAIVMQDKSKILLAHSEKQIPVGEEYEAIYIVNAVPDKQITAPWYRHMARRYWKKSIKAESLRVTGRKPITVKSFKGFVNKIINESRRLLLKNAEKKKFVGNIDLSCSKKAVNILTGMENPMIWVRNTRPGEMEKNAEGLMVSDDWLGDIDGVEDEETPNAEMQESFEEEIVECNAEVVIDETAGDDDYVDYAVDGVWREPEKSWWSHVKETAMYTQNMCNFGLEDVADFCYTNEVAGRIAVKSLEWTDNLQDLTPKVGEAVKEVKENFLGSTGKTEMLTSVVSEKFEEKKGEVIDYLVQELEVASNMMPELSWSNNFVEGFKNGWKEAKEKASE
ncbi:polyprotein [Morchella importuna RNA virus 1]|nr:polyprotein [Morchella importuna RNA virus 1]